MTGNSKLHNVSSGKKFTSSIEPEAVGSLFYNYLFEIDPGVKPMFRSPVPEQSKKLISMLSYVVSKLDRLDDIIDEVVKLSRRHVGYGVREELPHENQKLTLSLKAPLKMEVDVSREKAPAFKKWFDR